MSNSLSKTLALSERESVELTRRRLLAGAALTAGSLSIARLAQAQDAPVLPKSPPIELRIGELLPPVTLRSSGTSLHWDSAQLLGQRGWLAIIDAATSLYALNQSVAAAAKQANAAGATVTVVAPKRANQELNLAPDPIISLYWDGKNPLPTAPVILAVDKAGWLREIDMLPASGQDSESVRLSYVIAKIGDPTPAFAEGKPAPDFAFTDFDGISRRVSALRGKRNLLITFFPKCFTGRCKTHLSSLRDSAANFIAANTDVWAVSVDPAEGERGQKAFAQFINLPYPMLPDEGRNVCLLYGAAQSPNQLALRQSVLIDKDGIVRWIDRAIVPDTHGEDVLLKLKQLGLA